MFRFYGRRGVAAHSRAVLVVATWASSAPSAAQVIIEGGRNPVTLNTYVWTVTNNTSVPIVSFQFPHYHLRFLGPPEGWEVEITDPTAVGGKTGQRVVLFTATSPTAAIRPGRSAVFDAVITKDKATPGKLEATIGFADGTTVTVPDVEIPWRSSWIRKRALLIGFSTMFAVFLLVQVIRGRRKKKPGPEESPAPSQ